MNKKINIASCYFFLCNASFSQDIYTPINILTPNGTVVSNAYVLTGPDDLYSAAELAKLREDVLNNYNNAEIIDAPTAAYNCHGYAWYISEGGSPVWIEPGSEDVYWTDGSYVEVEENEATKVSYYNRSHSAIRLNSEWYQSKWGNSFLVKHHPNNVPAEYFPLLEKKYYKRNIPNMSIGGQTFVCNSAEYSVNNLQTDATVSWAYTSVTGNAPRIEQNTPSANSCIVTNTYRQIFEGYLNAEIKINGTVVKTLLKPIIGDSNNFSGVYMELSDDGSWVPDWPISLEAPNYATPSKTIVLESNHFRGKQVYYTIGDSFIRHGLPVNTNRVMFEMPILSNNELLTITVSGSDCSSPVKFTFTTNKSLYGFSNELRITSLDSDRYLLTIVDTANGQHSFNNISATENTSLWYFEIYNVVDTKQVMKQSVMGDCYTLDTSAWKPGGM